MDDYFIININWGRCPNPINAIDFSAGLDELEALANILELVGMSVYEPVSNMLRNTEDEYLTLNVRETCVEILSCDERIAPIPTQYIDTLIPALILAHLNDPVSVIHTYNEFFINKKEEITPLLDQ